MVAPTRPPKNGFIQGARKVYNPLGFSKGYNFVLWFIFAGALFGFTLARLQYLDFHGVFCKRGAGSTGAAPGECYFYLRGHYQVGILLHLACILPASLLAVFQFVPTIRHKAILVHRINGYIIILLALCGNAGALMVARTAFGGDLSTQGAAGALVILTTMSFILAFYNIKRLQIDQHRAWMLRAWFYFGTIITTRIIMIISAQIISAQGNFYTSRPCAELDFIYDNSQNRTLAAYPQCAAFYAGDATAQAVVKANFNGDPSQIGASLGMPFGMALWLSLLLHAFGVEAYLQLTPRESERLRQVSYERQLEAGFDHPGNAGLTVQRLGDANEWIPQRKAEMRANSTASTMQVG